jgi:protein-S-isoprenylcysteine O-methyltransferase Ste14
MAATQNTGTPRSDAPNPPFPPPLIFVLVFLTASVVNMFLPLQALPLGWNRVPALLLSLGGLGIFIGAALALRRAGTTVSPYKAARVLLTTGPFLRTRNPIYLAFAWIYLGCACLIASLWPFLFFPVIIVVMNRFVIAREEAWLEKRFGEAYRAYRARTRRWM